MIVLFLSGMKPYLTKGQIYICMRGQTPTLQGSIKTRKSFVRGLLSLLCLLLPCLNYPCRFVVVVLVFPLS